MPILAPAPNRYTEVAELIARLPIDLAASRTQLKLTTTVQAKQIGISKTTLTNLLAGKTPSYATVLAVLHWLAKN